MPISACTEDEFGAVVQSALLTASARAGVALLSRAKGENAEEVEALVGEIFKDQDEGATGD